MIFHTTGNLSVMNTIDPIQKWLHLSLIFFCCYFKTPVSIILLLFSYSLNCDFRNQVSKANFNYKHNDVPQLIFVFVQQYFCIKFKKTPSKNVPPPLQKRKWVDPERTTTTTTITHTLYTTWRKEGIWSTLKLSNQLQMLFLVSVQEGEI